MSTLEVVPAPSDEPHDPTGTASAAVPDLALGDPADPPRWFDTSDPAVGAAVRAHVLLGLNRHAVDTDVIADAMVLVSELVSNVRDHTPSERVGIRMRVDGGRIVVAVVEDRPAAARSDAFAPDTRGRGLAIVDAVATEWGFVRADRVATAWFALATAAAD